MNLEEKYFRQIKVLLSPLTPPNYEIEKASELILNYLGHRNKKKFTQRKKTTKNSTRPGAKKAKKKPNNTQIKNQEPNANSAAEAHDM